MTYRIQLLPTAEKALAALPHRMRNQIARRIDALADDPYPVGCKKLKGSSWTFFRIRTGDYRIVYQVQGTLLRVLVIRIGHRREIYRGL